MTKNPHKERLYDKNRKIVFENNVKQISFLKRLKHPVILYIATQIRFTGNRIDVIPFISFTFDKQRKDVMNLNPKATPGGLIESEI